MTIRDIIGLLLIVLGALDVILSGATFIAFVAIVVGIISLIWEDLTSKWR